jgi:hypothetical protein
VTSLSSPDIGSGFLASGMPAVLVTEVLESFKEAKRRFHLADYMPNAVEGGRFSEAVLRVLQWSTSGTYTALSDPKFKADLVIRDLALLPAGNNSESERLHIPRALRVIYDIRNKRNTAHLSDGIDPNLQDATIVVSVINWVLAEMVRMHHSISASEALALIEGLVSREVPLIEVFDGKPRILKDIGASDHILTLLYWKGTDGISLGELKGWLPEKMRQNSLRTVNGLHKKHLVNYSEPLVQITKLGLRYVDEEKLIQPL